MELRHLSYFICVAERLSFTAAAKHLYITQSAISNQIADLEKRLDVKLFIRTTHSVKLTEAGAVFLKEAYALLAQSEDAIKKTRQTATGKSVSIKIIFLESTVKNFLPPVIKGFRTNYPNIYLNLSQLYWDELIKALEHEEADVGFTISLSLINAPEITWRKIYTDTLCFVLPSEHHLAKPPIIDLAAISREPFIVLCRELAPLPSDLTLKVCANRGFTPKIINRPRLTETLLMLVEAGEGIALLPHHTSAYASSSLSFIPLEGKDAQVDIVAAWKKKNRNPAIPLLLHQVGLANPLKIL